MCDFFWQRMDSTAGADMGGDLADIVRSINGGGPSSFSSDHTAATNAVSWKFTTDADVSFQPLQMDNFTPVADGFEGLLHDLTSTVLDDDPSKSGSNNSGGGVGSNNNNNSCTSHTASDQQLPVHHKILIDDDMKRPCNPFSGVVPQNSPVKLSPLSPKAIKGRVPGHVGDVVKLKHSAKISSPRTPAGIKTRKNQDKKVICIPAPAAASSSQRGEVVPSDLWAWRKYGQKPIKGSPHPRGYYRCSSSKGCSARKQVERSQTDPNMLVITYTSEHNHSWPTQKSVLAGSTRPRPSKISAAPASKTCTLNQKPPTTCEVSTTTTPRSTLPILKEEAEAQIANSIAFNQGLFNNTGPVVARRNHSTDLFADLSRLEPDPTSIIFSSLGFVGDKSDEETESRKGLDPFMDMFDWVGGSFGDQSNKD